MTIKVRIIRANKLYWYKDFVGSVFEVNEEPLGYSDEITYKLANTIFNQARLIDKSEHLLRLRDPNFGLAIYKDHSIVIDNISNKKAAKFVLEEY